MRGMAIEEVGSESDPIDEPIKPRTIAEILADVRVGELPHSLEVAIAEQQSLDSFMRRVNPS